MEKVVTFLVGALMLVFMSSLVLAEGDITLDVIICQYGPNTNDWFLAPA